MEKKLIRKHTSHTTCITNNSSHPRPAPSSPSSLGMQKESLTISKTKPKIRIIHIFAPEIIKTDVENFRELVQRLTGKPSAADDHPKYYCHNKNKKPIVRSRQEELDQSSGGVSKITEYSSRDRVVKEEVGICSSDESNSGGDGGGGGGGYLQLGGFSSDLEGFISELAAEFPPLLPLDPTHNIHPWV